MLVSWQSPNDGHVGTCSLFPSLVQQPNAVASNYNNILSEIQLTLNKYCIHAYEYTGIVLIKNKNISSCYNEFMSYTSRTGPNPENYGTHMDSMTTMLYHISDIQLEATSVQNLKMQFYLQPHTSCTV
jgi:hypothetical protein